MLYDKMLILGEHFSRSIYRGRAYICLYTHTHIHSDTHTHTHTHIHTYIVGMQTSNLIKAGSLYVF